MPHGQQPDAAWQRYHEFADKRDAETLKAAEHSELMGLSETIEMTDVQRLEYMSELASLRGVSLRMVRTQLGITDRKGNGNA